MDIYYESKPGLLKQSALALGYFDGVHCGHQAVIKKAVEDGRRLGIPAAVVTFKEHPRLLTLGKSPALLTTLEQRLALFAQLGLDATLVLSFTDELCRLSPSRYVETVLVKSLGARCVAVGFNHHFGSNREGNPALLEQLGYKFAFEVGVVQPLLLDGLEVSSSRIREALVKGDVGVARKLLGRTFTVASEVIQGDRRGRKLGFPTANLFISDTQILPGRGVYAGLACLPDGSRLPAVVNLGYRPTVTAGAFLTAEVHILDFQGELYGQSIQVEFWQFLRNETKFACINDLKRQISKDCLSARQLFPGGPGYTVLANSCKT